MHFSKTYNEIIEKNSVKQYINKIKIEAHFFTFDEKTNIFLRKKM